MSRHTVQWVTASPLWSSALDDGLDRMRAPAILRFERDTFMDDLARTLEDDPASLAADVATKVTYRLPAPGEPAPPEPPELKLFQAAHGHFHLVAASLTCRLPGLPDRDVASDEQVAFVLRRIDDDGEWAWAADPDTPSGRTWAPVEDALAVAEGEELLPLFPVRYEAPEKLRRVFVGLVPTSSSDTFKGVGTLSPLQDPPAGDPRAAALATKVTDPMRALAKAPTGPPDDVTDPDQRQAIAKTEADTLVEASRFLLVDFAELLVTQVPLVWDALKTGKAPQGFANAALYSALAAERPDSLAAPTWRDALIAAWSSKLVLFGDQTGTLPQPLNLGRSTLSPDDLDAYVGALPKPTAPPDGTTSIQGDTVPPPQVPKLDARGRWRYRIRCVYRRPRCRPPVPDVVSEPTEPFQIAGFFDLDAPARPIYVSLPVDTGIGDLRKLRKNVNFLISNQLRAQMNRVTSLNDALKGQFASGGDFDLGLICSFSIPIITICALLVLMIFIQLLNIVFWWMPFLRICFPIGLKAGKS